MSIAFFTEHVRFPWRRQLDQRSAPEGWRPFTFNAAQDDCELLVVYDDLLAPFACGVARERRAVVLSEPPAIKRYRKSYLRQFGIVLGPVDPECDGVRWIPSQPALPYFFGVGFVGGQCVPNLSLDEIAALPPPPKSETVSVVISAKTRTPMHRQRLAFVEALEKRIGARLSVFGTGFTKVPDKADAILPHAYHLVLENNDIDSFWTEKTADAYLGWSLPLFSGCHDIGRYFAGDSLIRINPADVAGAVAEVERVLDEKPYAARLPAIAAARSKLLGSYELGAALQAVAAAMPSGTPLRAGTPDLMRPNRDLGPAGRFEPMARAWARKLLRR